MKVLKSIFSFKVYVWILVVVCAGFAAMWFIGSKQSSDPKLQINSQVKYIEKVEEVVFLNAGIQKVIKASDSNKVFGVEIPFSKKTALIIMNYKAKFGIKNKVNIKQSGEGSYIVTVPEFEVIGIELAEKNPYELYDTDGELLSLGTKDIDTAKLVSKGLSNKSQKQYLEQFGDAIKESATEYYKNLFASIDDSLRVKVEFKD